MKDINLQAVFRQFTCLEECYLPGAPVGHDILLILENALLGGEVMLVNDLTSLDEHLHLINNVLRVAYQVGRNEAAGQEYSDSHRFLLCCRRLFHKMKKLRIFRF